MAGGFRSTVGRQVGGLSAPPVTIQAGFRSLVGRQVGGVSSPIAVVQAGFRSLLGRWFGGASAPIVIPPIPPRPSPTDSGGGAGGTRRNLAQERYDHRQRILRDDDELFCIISSFLEVES